MTIPVFFFAALVAVGFTAWGAILSLAGKKAETRGQAQAQAEDEPEPITSVLPALRPAPIDLNLASLEEIDWPAEMNAILAAFDSPDTNEAERGAYRVSIGRCLLLMQEYAPRELLDVAFLFYIERREGLEAYRRAYLETVK